MKLAINLTLFNGAHTVGIFQGSSISYSVALLTSDDSSGPRDSGVKGEQLGWRTSAGHLKHTTIRHARNDMGWFDSLAYKKRGGDE